MNTKNVNLQFCGWAKPIDGQYGTFYSMELNKEQLGKIITDYQNQNEYVDLSIAEKKGHKPDEKNTHYVFSNVRYQDGQDTSSDINIRIYKEKLSEVPTKEEHKAYFVTISPVDKEKKQSQGKEAKTDFNVYIKGKDSEQTYYIGAGWDAKAQREATKQQNSLIDICGSAVFAEKDGKNYYKVMLNKGKAQNMFDIFPEKFMDFTLAEKKEHTADEKSTHYIYPSLKYQNETDNNPNAVMTLRIFKEEFDKAKQFNGEHSILAGVYARDKEKGLAEGKEYKSDYVIYANKPGEKGESVYLGAGFNKTEQTQESQLEVGNPVHIKVNDPVLREFIGHTEQTAFGYLVAEEQGKYKVHCTCGTYLVEKENIKKATVENVSKFDTDYNDMRGRLTKEKSPGNAKVKPKKTDKSITEVNIKDKKDPSVEM